MTDQVDEQAARERLEHERTRVGGLISELRGEGLDVEQSDQSGDIASFDANQEDQASELNEREKDLAILEGLESDLAEIEALALAWRAAAERTLLAAYEAVLGDGSDGLDADGAGLPLLPLFRADKLLDDIVYEAENRQLLLSIPLKSALELVEPAAVRAEETVA